MSCDPFAGGRCLPRHAMSWMVVAGRVWWRLVDLGDVDIRTEERRILKHSIASRVVHFVGQSALISGLALKLRSLEDDQGTARKNARNAHMAG